MDRPLDQMPLLADAMRAKATRSIAVQSSHLPLLPRR